MADSFYIAYFSQLISSENNFSGQSCGHTANLTALLNLLSYEKERNKKISKVRYIVEQYFGLSHLHDGAKRARFTNIVKNRFDCWYRQTAYNISRGLKILGVVTV